MTEDLTTKRCTDLPKGTPALTGAEVAVLLARLHGDWQAAGGKLSRRFAVKGYPPAVMLANAAALLAEREGHHPDVSFGWGWVEVSFWTHTVGGLSENDFICAAKLDAMVAAP
jgi:4a-hydroxytetrahydrobiopterin dehydratase